MILIVDMNSSEGSLGFFEFVLPIVSIVGREDCEVTNYSDIRETDLEECDAIVLSGVPLKDNKFMEQKEEFGWIKDCGKPILGICAGMQIIGMLFGSSIIESKEIGMTDVKMEKENALFSSNLRVYELHNYSVEPSDEFEVLAVSEKCVQAIKHKDRDIYGVLFHPEVRNREIIERFISHKWNGETGKFK
jgi:GMP synthase-like glutamine amidotransferase